MEVISNFIIIMLLTAILCLIVLILLGYVIITDEANKNPKLKVILKNSFWGLATIFFMSLFFLILYILKYGVTC